jgi:hypothetical protein
MSVRIFYLGIRSIGKQGWRISKGDIPMKLRIGCVVVGLLSLVLSLAAQTAGSNSASAQVPPLIQFSNVATDEGGSSLSGVVSITFSLYNSQQGGEPLWTETQNNVQLDPTGHYSVQLGITKPNGVPTSLFTSGEARWLGVQIAGQAEQARVLLLSVPYALKAGDAATIGGLPPSAFVLATPPNGTASVSTTESVTEQTVSPATTTDVTTSGGTVNFLPLWDATSDITSSVLFQSGTGSTAKIGINTATPATTLDVKGAGTIRGTLSLPALGTATATKGSNSQPLSLAGSAFNSGTSAAVTQTFRWQAEPAGNDTATPSATLNLLFAEANSAPAETGLNIASSGLITFATGQQFPGSLSGTVTSVDSGLGLKGGPITTDGTLTIDTTVVPQLGAANNTFTGNETVDGNVTAGKTVSGAFGKFNGSSDNADVVVTNPSGNGINVTSPGEGSVGISLSGNSSSGWGIGLNNALVGMEIEDVGTGISIIGNTGITSNANVSNAVYGSANNDLAQLAAIIGIEQGTTTANIGVEGITSSNAGAAMGVYGVSVTGNTEGLNDAAVGEGVVGDSSAGFGVVGFSDQNQGVTGLTGDSNNEGIAAGYFDNINSDASARVLFTYGFNVGGFCNIDVSGNLTCSGTVGPASQEVQVDGRARKVALNAIAGPENWFEDAGSAQLSNGEAVVTLEQIFGQTVNTEMEYHVFLTPKGDCKGLYVTNETGISFVVRELGGGTSSIAFDYRIMAKRRGYEGIRLADVTKQSRKPASKSSMNGVGQPRKYQPPPQPLPAHRNGSIRPVSQAVAVKQ